MRKENKNFGITAIFFKINISNIQYIYMCIFMLYQVICTILRNEKYRKVRFKEYLSSISHPAQNKHDSATTCINLFCKICFMGVRVMVFNATFNNTSAILWQSALPVQETEAPGENHKPAASHWQTLSHNVSSTPRLSGLQTHNVSGDRHRSHR